MCCCPRSLRCGPCAAVLALRSLRRGPCIFVAAALSHSHTLVLRLARVMPMCAHFHPLLAYLSPLVTSCSPRFDQFDKNANGEIDLAELRDAFKGVREALENETREVNSLEARIATLTAFIGEVRVGQYTWPLNKWGGLFWLLPRATPPCGLAADRRISPDLPLGRWRG